MTSIDYSPTRLFALSSNFWFHVVCYFVRWFPLAVYIIILIYSWISAKKIWVILFLRFLQRDAHFWRPSYFSRLVSHFLRRCDHGAGDGHPRLPRQRDHLQVRGSVLLHHGPLQRPRHSHGLTLHQCCWSMTFGVDPDPGPRIHAFDPDPDPLFSSLTFKMPTKS